MKNIDTRYRGTGVFGLAWPESWGGGFYMAACPSGPNASSVTHEAATLAETLAGITAKIDAKLDSGFLI